MTRTVAILVALAAVAARPAEAQIDRPRANTVAVGGDVGFLAPDNGSGDAQALQATTGTVDAFIEYYYAPRASLRAMYSWASPRFEATRDRSLRRQHLNLNFVYGWDIGRFRPFATIGGGTYFLSRRESGAALGGSVAKPGASVGWGGEVYLRTFAVKSEMNVHILDDEQEFPELNGRTLTGFTWTFGIKIPL